MLENLSIQDDKRKHRIAMKYDPSLNPDHSVDARKAIAHCPTERVKTLKTSASTSGGQYTPSSSKVATSRLVTYKYLPNQVFRRYPDNTEIAVLERLDGDWFICDDVMLSQSEITSLRAFDGAYGMDIDAAMKRKKKRSVTSKPVRTTNDGGKYSYRCDPMHDVDQALFDREIRMHNAKKLKSLLSSVRVETVKRKK